MKLEGLRESVLGDGLIAHNQTDNDFNPTLGRRPADPLKVFDGRAQAGEDLLVHRKAEDDLCVFQFLSLLVFGLRFLIL